jgi:hypothetical protein
MPSTYWPDADRIECPFAGSLAISINDLIWQDSAALVTTAYNVLPANAMTTAGGSKAGSQAYLAPKFMGVAKEARTASQTQTDRGLLVDRCYVGPMTITSGIYYQGDLVTFYSAVNDGSGILNGRVEKTTTASSAIGFVVKDTGGVAVTTVTVCLISRVLPKYMPVMSTTNSAGMVMDDGANIAANTTTGTKIGTAAAQKLGFWNATPVIQQASNAQNAVATTVGAALLTNASVQNTGFGYATNTIADSVITNVNTLRVDVLAINTLVNRLRADLVTVGIIKGVA